jgi:hypothetical protein
MEQGWGQGRVRGWQCSRLQPWWLTSREAVTARAAPPTSRFTCICHGQVSRRLVLELEVLILSRGNVGDRAFICVSTAQRRAGSTRDCQDRPQSGARGRGAQTPLAAPPRAGCHRCRCSAAAHSLLIPQKPARSLSNGHRFMGRGSCRAAATPLVAAVCRRRASEAQPFVSREPVGDRPQHVQQCA